MNHVILKKITFENFKGVKKRETIFDSKITSIYGRNKAGKSRHLDGFLWLLFGKDSKDRVNHEIYTTENMSILEKVDASVEAVLDVDGKEIVLKRTFKQDWRRKRGAEVETYEGNTTLYHINGEVQKAGEYNDFINNIITENLFRMFTNPLYFLSLAWKTQRDILFEIAGTLSDVEVLDRMENKSTFIKNLINEGQDIDKFKSSLTTKKTAIRKELALIQPKIDQTVKLTPEAVNFDAFRKELESIDVEIAKIDAKIADLSKADEEFQTKARERQRQVGALKMQQLDVIQKAEENAKKGNFSQNMLRNDLTDTLKTTNAELAKVVQLEQMAKKEGEPLARSREKVEKQLNALRVQWIATSDLKFDASKSVCFECGQPIQGGEEAFTERRAEKLKELNERGKEIQGKLRDYDVLIKESKEEITNITKRKDDLLASLQDTNEKLANTPYIPPKAVVPEELPEWTALKSQIDIILKSVGDVKEADTTELTAKKKELTSERDDIKTILADELTIKNNEKEIEALNEEARVLSVQLADLDKQEYEINQFNSIKITDSETRINNLFKVVSFKLFDYTFEGNPFEVCIPTNKEGVPISTTNNAEVIQGGLDIIKTLCNFYNQTAPIFIDNRESVNELPKMDSQIINLVVTKGDLTVKKGDIE